MTNCEYCEHPGGDTFICGPLTSVTVVHPGGGKDPEYKQKATACPTRGIDGGCPVAIVAGDTATFSIMPVRSWTRFEERLRQAAAQLNGRVYESTPDTKT